MDDLSGIPLLKRNLLDFFGVADASSWLGTALLLGMVVAASAVVYAMARIIVVGVIKRLTRRTSTIYDDIIFSDKVMRRLSRLFPSITLVMFGGVFEDTPTFMAVYAKTATIVFVCVVSSFLLSLSRSLFEAVQMVEKYREKSLHSLLQAVNLIIYCVAIILVISIAIDKSPTVLLAGLGASAAVLSLVFKDSLVGFISGIQLTAGNMLAVGDWIKVPKHNANGIVTEVSLHAVKIRNWDNTISTVPPSVLMSESFCNWRPMFDSGGRRITRAINIDMNSVHFCTPEQVERIRQIPLMADYFASEPDTSELTNLGAFRHYMKAYLMKNDNLNPELITMVRYLEPSEFGLPVQVYCFSADKNWVNYEGIMADIIDHMVASVGMFELKVYQVIASQKP